MIALTSGKHQTRFTVTTTAPSQTVTFTLLKSSVPFNVSWGDGSQSALAANSEAAVAHTYATTGVYSVVLSSSALLTKLACSDSKVSFARGTVGGLHSLTYLYLNTLAGVTIGAGEIGGLTSLTTLILSNLVHLSVLASLPAKIVSIDYQNSLSQANIDAFLSVMYSARATFTAATPTCNLLGSGNAAPSGTYQAHVPPTSGKETVYDLVNDPNSEGFHKWSITTA